MNEPSEPNDPSEHHARTEQPEPGRHAADPSQRPLRDLLRDAAYEAEYSTGRRERTPDDAQRSLAVHIGRLVLGWALVLLGLAGLVLPGPGWLIVLLGLSMLPYAWTDRMIREIRRRIPGIPEDGRIPTRTWVIMGAAIVLTTGASIWWGLRSDDEPAPRNDRAAAEDRGRATKPVEIRVATPADPAAAQIGRVYGEVAAVARSGDTTPVEAADPCATVVAGDADLAVVTRDAAAACLGVGSERSSAVDESAVRSAAEEAGVKLYGPVTSDGVTYWPMIRHAVVPVDDEETETAIDGVSGVITGGAPTAGVPSDRAESLMKDAGVGR